jgi:cytochrome P450
LTDQTSVAPKMPSPNYNAFIDNSPSPWAVMADDRRNCPVGRVEVGDFSYVQVSDSTLIDQAARAANIFSNRMGVLPKGPEPEGEQVLDFADPPEHTVHRRLISRAFAAARINEMTDRIGQIADDLIDGIAARGQTFDVRADFARQLPSQIVSEMLGIPAAETPYFIGLTEQAEALMGDPDVEAWNRANNEFMDYVLGQLDMRDSTPRDDLLTAILQAEDSGQRFTRREAAALVRLLLGAGNGTTSIAMSNTIYLLETHPDQKALFLSDPDRYASSTIEEGLRFDCPVQGNFRGVTEDTTLGGYHIEAGDRIFMLYSAANHDPATYPEPEQFRIDRDWKKLPPHFAFGRGIHYCIGANLARVESSIGLRALYRRMPNLRLAEGFQPEQLPGMVFRTWQSLPMVFDGPALPRTTPPSTQRDTEEANN